MLLAEVFSRDGILSGLFLHYEAKDVVYCHTCLLGFKLKRMKTNSADPAFVSGMQYQNMYKNIIEIFSIIATIII